MRDHGATTVTVSLEKDHKRMLGFTLFTPTYDSERVRMQIDLSAYVGKYHFDFNMGVGADFARQPAGYWQRRY